jgi:hypothetical protein
MNPMYGLTADERRVLHEAMEGPLEDRDPVVLGICLKLVGLRLLQRAGAAATLNGWRGSPNAFFLTRDGWAFLKEERGGAPLWRTG